ncbi:MAG: hypothetical protein IKG15_09295 [Solobacterium sp.]|nr:hypothetical protein [Solobacterium sp.]
MKTTRRLAALAAGLILLFGTAACAAPEQAETPEPTPETKQEEEIQEEEHMEKTMHLYINETELPVIWEDNESVQALTELAASEPLDVNMSMYGGFEQVGSLGRDLPRSDRQTVTQAGDIVLYSGNQVVIFYGSNSWAYTRLGKADGVSASRMRELLGNGDVTLTFVLE